MCRRLLGVFFFFFAACGCQNIQFLLQITLSSLLLSCSFEKLSCLTKTSRPAFASIFIHSEGKAIIQKMAFWAQTLTFKTRKRAVESIHLRSNFTLDLLRCFFVRCLFKRGVITDSHRFLSAHRILAPSVLYLPFPEPNRRRGTQKQNTFHTDSTATTTFYSGCVFLSLCIQKLGEGSVKSFRWKERDESVVKRISRAVFKGVVFFAARTATVW